MPGNLETATADFWRVTKIILVAALVFTVGSIIYLGSTGELYFHMVVAVVGGVFLSVVLGCGLFAAAFFSDKSGHDALVSDATKPHVEED